MKCTENAPKMTSAAVRPSARVAATPTTMIAIASSQTRVIDEATPTPSRRRRSPISAIRRSTSTEAMRCRIQAAAPTL
jgi:hypothetical protein